MKHIHHGGGGVKTQTMSLKVMEVVVFCCRKYKWLGRPRRTGGGAECSQCRLVFDNSSLLDLHILSHSTTGNYCHSLHHSTTSALAVTALFRCEIFTL